MLHPKQLRNLLSLSKPVDDTVQENGDDSHVFTHLKLQETNIIHILASYVRLCIEV